MLCRKEKTMLSIDIFDKKEEEAVYSEARNGLLQLFTAFANEIDEYADNKNKVSGRVRCIHEAQMLIMKELVDRISYSYESTRYDFSKWFEKEGSELIYQEKGFYEPKEAVHEEIHRD